MSDNLDPLHSAAGLVRRWGQTRLPNGNTLSETLTLDGVSLWEVIAPVLAAFILPKELASKTRTSLFDRLIRPHLSRARHQAQARFSFPHSTEGCARWPAKPTCLLLGYSGYMYRDILEPLARYFAENNHIDYVALHDDARFQPSVVKLRGDGIQSIWEHWNSQVAARELELQRRLAAAVNYLKTPRALPALVSNSRRTLWTHVETTFKWLWSRGYLASLIPYLALTQHILEEHRPSIIVSPDVADPRTRLFCLAGHVLGIPSLEVQFGMYDEGSIEWQFCVADRVAVWGERARQVLSAHGVPEDNIVLTGSPRFDCLTNTGHEQAVRVRSRLGIPDGHIMVLFASLYTLGRYEFVDGYCSRIEDIKRAVFQTADEVEGACLVVKPHPLENVQEIKQIAAGFEKIIFVDSSDDIRELTKACDVFITLGSTATMDALITRKLVIFPAFPGMVWRDYAYLKSNAVVMANSKEQLTRCLRAVVSGQRELLLDELEPARQRFLQEWVYRTDGQAAARIAALAQQMMNTANISMGASASYRERS